MQSFDKKNQETLIDSYSRQVASSQFRKRRQFQTRTSITSIQNKANIIDRIKVSGIFALKISTIILLSLIAYYPSVKVARYLGIKGFWKVHFAIFPIMVHWNAGILGAYKGISLARKIQDSYLQK